MMKGGKNNRVWWDFCTKVFFGLPQDNLIKRPIMCNYLCVTVNSIIHNHKTSSLMLIFFNPKECEELACSKQKNHMFKVTPQKNPRVRLAAVMAGWVFSPNKCVIFTVWFLQDISRPIINQYARKGKRFLEL